MNKSDRLQGRNRRRYHHSPWRRFPTSFVPPPASKRTFGSGRLAMSCSLLCDPVAIHCFRADRGCAPHLHSAPGCTRLFRHRRRLLCGTRKVASYLSGSDPDADHNRPRRRRPRHFTGARINDRDESQGRSLPVAGGAHANGRNLHDLEGRRGPACTSVFP